MSGKNDKKRDDGKASESRLVKKPRAPKKGGGALDLSEYRDFKDDIYPHLVSGELSVCLTPYGPSILKVQDTSFGFGYFKEGTFAGWTFEGLGLVLRSDPDIGQIKLGEMIKHLPSLTVEILSDSTEGKWGLKLQAKGDKKQYVVDKEALAALCMAVIHRVESRQLELFKTILRVFTHEEQLASIEESENAKSLHKIMGALTSVLGNTKLSNDKLEEQKTSLEQHFIKIPEARSVWDEVVGNRSVVSEVLAHMGEQMLPFNIWTAVGKNKDQVDSIMKKTTHYSKYRDYLAEKYGVTEEVSNGKGRAEVVILPPPPRFTRLVNMAGVIPTIKSPSWHKTLLGVMGIPEDLSTSGKLAELVAKVKETFTQRVMQGLTKQESTDEIKAAITKDHAELINEVTEVGKRENAFAPDAQFGVAQVTECIVNELNKHIDKAVHSYFHTKTMKYYAINQQTRALELQEKEYTGVPQMTRFFIETLLLVNEEQYREYISDYCTESGKGGGAVIVDHETSLTVDMFFRDNHTKAARLLYDMVARMFSPQFSKVSFLYYLNRLPLDARHTGMHEEILIELKETFKKVNEVCAKATMLAGDALYLLLKAASHPEVNERQKFTDIINRAGGGKDSCIIDKGCLDDYNEIDLKIGKQLTSAIILEVESEPHSIQFYTKKISPDVEIIPGGDAASKGVGAGGGAVGSVEGGQAMDTEEPVLGDVFKKVLKMLRETLLEESLTPEVVEEIVQYSKKNIIRAGESRDDIDLGQNFPERSKNNRKTPETIALGEFAKLFKGLLSKKHEVLRTFIEKGSGNIIKRAEKMTQIFKDLYNGEKNDNAGPAKEKEDAEDDMEEEALGAGPTDPAADAPAAPTTGQTGEGSAATGAGPTDPAADAPAAPTTGQPGEGSAATGAGPVDPAAAAAAAAMVEMGEGGSAATGSEQGERGPTHADEGEDSAGSSEDSAGSSEDEDSEDNTPIAKRKRRAATL